MMQVERGRKAWQRAIQRVKRQALRSRMTGGAWTLGRTLGAGSSLPQVRERVKLSRLLAEQQNESYQQAAQDAVPRVWHASWVAYFAQHVPHKP